MATELGGPDAVGAAGVPGGICRYSQSFMAVMVMAMAAAGLPRVRTPAGGATRAPGWQKPGRFASPIQREGGRTSSQAHTRSPHPPSQRGPPGAAPPQAGREPALQGRDPHRAAPANSPQEAGGGEKKKDARHRERTRACAPARATDRQASFSSSPTSYVEVSRGRRRDTIGTRLLGGPTGRFGLPDFLTSGLEKSAWEGNGGDHLQDSLLLMEMGVFSPPPFQYFEVASRIKKDEAPHLIHIIISLLVS